MIKNNETRNEIINISKLDKDFKIWKKQGKEALEL